MQNTKSFGDRFFDRAWILAPTMLAIAGYEYFTNASHAKTWIVTKGTIEAFRPVCRFEKHFWFHRNSSFSEEFCDDQAAIKLRMQDGWEQVPQRKVMLELDIINSIGNHERRQFEPWASDIPTPVAVGATFDVQYSETSIAGIDFAGKPSREATDAIKAVAMTIILCIVTFTWWRIRKLRGRWI